jgi:hypothetical protein
MNEKTYIERIIGGEQADKEKALKMLQEIYEGGPEDFKKFEIPKNLETEELIKKVEEHVDRMVSGYGVTPKPFPRDRIFILKPGSVPEISDGKLERAMFRSLGGVIGVEENRSRFSLAGGMAHELLHFKSNKSVQTGKKTEDVHLYRSGLSMVDRKVFGSEDGKVTEYFDSLEEAVVAECNRRLMEDLGQDDFFREEYLANQEFKSMVAAYFRRIGLDEDKAREFERDFFCINKPEARLKDVKQRYDNEDSRESYAAGMFQGLYENGMVEFFERCKFRKRLYELIDRLFEKTQGEYGGKDQIFEVIARANFTGNYLPFARLVEKALGKGSFRKLAEDFSRQHQIGDNISQTHNEINESEAELK